MTELLLGIDVGTSACKAAVVDADGVEVAHGQAPTPWEPVPTGAELDPDALLAAVARAAREALAHAPEGAWPASASPSMAETGMLLDATGASCTARSPGTTRAATPRRGRSARDLPDFSARTGLPASALCSLAKLTPTSPSTRRGVRWLNVAEWIVHRLGGAAGRRALALLAHRPARPRPARAVRRRARLGGPARRPRCAEAVLAGTDAGRSDGAALPGTGAPSSPWPATTTSSPASASAWSRPATCSTRAAPPRRSCASPRRSTPPRAGAASRAA